MSNQCYYSMWITRKRNYVDRYPFPLSFPFISFIPLPSFFLASTSLSFFLLHWSFFYLSSSFHFTVLPFILIRFHSLLKSSLSFFFLSVLSLNHFISMPLEGDAMEWCKYLQIKCTLGKLLWWEMRGVGRGGRVWSGRGD